MIWRVAVADTALSDYDEIIAWTALRYDQVQAERYGEAIDRALFNLREGPEAQSCRLFEHAGVVYRLYAVRFGRRRGRHILACRSFETPAPTLRVYRILHEHMDFARHLPSTDKDPA